MASETDAVSRYRFPIRGVIASARDRAASTAQSAESLAAGSKGDVQDVEATMSSERTRNLVLRFWNLASSERREIAIGLGLMRENELQLPEAERYGRALTRAAEQGLLEKVVVEIEKREALNGG
jgi:hypothetical protein